MKKKWQRSVFNMGGLLLALKTVRGLSIICDPSTSRSSVDVKVLLLRLCDVGAVLMQAPRAPLLTVLASVAHPIEEDESAATSTSLCGVAARSRYRRRSRTPEPERYLICTSEVGANDGGAPLSMEEGCLGSMTLA